MSKYALIAILSCLLAACSSDSSPQNIGAQAIPVRVSEVLEQDVPLYLESLGTLKSTHFVEIRPQVNGLLLQIQFTEGETVEQGHPLFIIDPQPYQIKLQEAEAQLAQDRAALTVSQKKKERYEALAKKDLIPQQDWDELVYQVAKNEAQITADEAKLASASLDLKHCYITAPIAGRTGKITVHPGNLVQASQTTPLVTLADIDDLFVEFTLTEQEFQQLHSQSHSATKTSIEIYSFYTPDEIISGSLNFQDHSFNKQSGLLQMRGHLLNPSLKLLPEQSVKVRLPISTLKAARLVPQKAVKINQQGTYVYRVKADNTVELCQLSCGVEFNDNIVVLDGLQPGDRVITEGHLRLHPGMPVDIKTETPANN